MNAEKLLKICDYITKGMTEKESCILADVPYDIFLKLKENDEATRNLLEKKAVEFKYLHIEAIQRNKNDKNSMYLLEKLRPDEFGSKAKNDQPTINIISAIIKEIQNDNSQSIVRFNRGERQSSDQDARLAVVKGADLLK